MVTDQCPFCAIVSGQDKDAQVLYRSQRYVVFAPLRPATRGHLLVVPTAHRSDLADVDRIDLHSAIDAVQDVRRAISQTLQPEGVNIIQSNGEIATQTVGHVHFHVVPRWPHDRFQLGWPSEQDSTPSTAADRHAVSGALPRTLTEVQPEDRRQHLAFIQDVISRMAQSSASVKTWLLPIVTATLGFAFTQEQVLVALMAVVVTLLFGLLDANYLKQERAFRKLYDKVAAGSSIPQFAMNPTVAASEGHQNYWPDLRDLMSWSIAPFYLPIVALGLALILWLWLL